MEEETDYHIECDIDEEHYEFYLTVKDVDLEHKVEINGVCYFVDVVSESEHLEKVTNLFLQSLAKQPLISKEAIIRSLEEISF